MKITKVRLKSDGGVSLEYTTTRHDTVQSVSTTISEEPRPELKEALDELKGFVIEAHRLADIDEVRDSLTVTGINISERGEGERFSVTACLKVEDANSPENITTALRTLYSSGEREAKDQVDGRIVEKVEKVRDEAERYLKGETAQGDLFASGQEEEEAEQDETVLSFSEADEDTTAFEG